MASNRLNDIWEMLKALAEYRHLIVKKNDLAAGAVIGAVCTGVGSFFGPGGLAAGAAVGVVTAAWWTADEERPLTQVLRDLPRELKDKLSTGVSALLEGLVWPTLAALQERVMRNEILLNKILSFLQHVFEQHHMGHVVPRLP
ncbi:hypothetical protein KOW79_008642 [Hemibagrus wyckioides]|uniref:Uncharacterized protein n=1 Tax=Hemibagrus wyckioides TaxID=337641 RepID=A0A9D3SRD8_9TELE|nr:hypothetical protein KOW79_008642 [Hemibagrus wyckioides]